MRTGKKNILGDIESNGTSIKPLVGNISDLSLSNEILTKDINSQNLILNGDFEYWYAGISSAPDGWQLLGGGSIEKETTEVPIKFNNSVKLTSDVDGNSIDTTYYGLSIWFDKFKGKILSYSVWIHAVDADIARIRLWDGVDVSYSSYHTGGGDWELLTVTHTVNINATRLQTQIRNQGNTKIIYTTGAMLVESSAPFAYSPHPEDHLYKQEIIWINHHEATTGEAQNGESSLSPDYFAYPNVVDNRMFFPFRVPYKVCDHIVVVDEITIYYGIRDDDVATNNSADYIDEVAVRKNLLTSSATSVLSHTDNLGDDTYNADQNHQIVDNSFEMEDYPIFLRVSTVQDITSSDIRIYGFKVKYHTKVHG